MAEHPERTARESGPEGTGLVGHRFDGGIARVEAWENALFHMATGRSEVPRHDHVHPACAFHVPIRSAGTSIAEMFALTSAEGPAGVGVDHFAFDYHRPWMVDRDLEAEGFIEAWEPVLVDSRVGRRPADRVTFRFDLVDDGRPVVTSRICWWVFRPDRAVNDGDRIVGDEPEPDAPGAPHWSSVIENVSPDNMRLAAALFRDPYPMHWDVEVSEAAGLGRRVVNQTPLNTAYLVNLLIDAHGLDPIRRLRVRFPGLVFGGDAVVAEGRTTADGEVDLRLLRKGRPVAVATAVLRGPASDP